MSKVIELSQGFATVYFEEKLSLIASYCVPLKIALLHLIQESRQINKRIGQPNMTAPEILVEGEKGLESANFYLPVRADGRAWRP